MPRMTPVHWKELEGEVPVAVIRNNLKTAGISRDEYFRLLGRS